MTIPIPYPFHFQIHPTVFLPYFPHLLSFGCCCRLRSTEPSPSGPPTGCPCSLWCPRTAPVWSPGWCLFPLWGPGGSPGNWLAPQVCPRNTRNWLPNPCWSPRHQVWMQWSGRRRWESILKLVSTTIPPHPSYLSLWTTMHIFEIMIGPFPIFNDQIYGHKTTFSNKSKIVVLTLIPQYLFLQ